MNYKLIMTEGTDELALIEVLIEKDLFIFKKEELLMEQPFHKRQIDGELTGYIQGLSYGDTIDIYRIGDKLSDKLKIPRSILDEKIRNKFKICTLPEFEILFILNEGIFDNFLRNNKGNLKPSEFYKSHNSEYKKQAVYIKQYFSKMSEDEIISLINLYVEKRGKMHNHDELTLKAIVKEKIKQTNT